MIGLFVRFGSLFLRRMRVFLSVAGYLPISFFRRVAILASLGTLYLLIHLFYGKNSIFTYFELLDIAQIKKIEMMEWQQKNQTLLNEIEMSSGDRDYLEEVAKERLRYSSSKEKVLILRK